MKIVQQTTRDDGRVYYCGYWYTPNTKCYICKKIMYIAPSRIKPDSCCSYLCMGAKKRGMKQKDIFVTPFKVPKGTKPWNIGIKWKKQNTVPCIVKNCLWCGITFFIKAKKTNRKFCSIWCSSHSTGFWAGKSRPEISGDRHYRWQKNRTELHDKWLERKKLEYIQWRKKIMERDNYTCKFCGKNGGKLEVDHIKPFAKYPELRTILSNGRTLCHDCHTKTETYGNRKAASL